LQLCNYSRRLDITSCYLLPVQRRTLSRRLITLYSIVKLLNNMLDQDFELAVIISVCKY
jgi:hypothetical protein